MQSTQRYNTNSNKNRKENNRELKKKSKYITKENYVDMAQEVWKNIKDSKGKIQMTTSKIRNILSLNMAIYNDVMLEKEEKLSLDIRDNIQYLKVRLLYESGRDTQVSDFVEVAQLLEEIDRIGDKREKYLTFSRYLESLVAYHRYFGGRDN